MQPPPIHMSPSLSIGEPQMSPTSTSECNNLNPCRWRPYSKSNEFEANIAMVLIIVFCALICSMALNAAIRCFLRSGGGGRRPRFSLNNLPLPQGELEQRKPVSEAAGARMVATPIMVYSIGMKLAATETECAICLSEFVEGEGIQVLPNCRHGFHVQCIQQWLSSNSSCPTCRCSCLSSSSTSEETSQQCIDYNSQTEIAVRET